MAHGFVALLVCELQVARTLLLDALQGAREFAVVLGLPFHISVQGEFADDPDDVILEL